MIKSTGNLFEKPNPAMFVRRTDPHTSHLNAAAVVSSKEYAGLNQRILEVLRKCTSDMTSREIAFALDPQNWLAMYMKVWKRMFILVNANEIEVACERRSNKSDNGRIVQAYRIKSKEAKHDPQN